ncbi:PAS domain-containing sensor histidine kinase [Halobaculum limi]|uniref:PAS domain-containing sensor histidine kinase n=1 Tax=Halobaculum limi TaxID=3031916 RepID=UPI00240564BF|nr:PAS domain-containing sensor histidine kinase [Halobaculum sp. YSMS11]
MQRRGNRRLVDHVQEAVVLLDEEYLIVDVNDSVESMLGFEPTAYVGFDPFEFVHPDDRVRVMQEFNRAVAMEGNLETAIEFRHEMASGSYRWIAARVSSLPDHADAAYVVSARDVSDRVAAETRGETIENRLSELTTTAKDVLWTYTADWEELLFVNPAYEEIYGQSPERLRDSPQAFLETIHPDDLPKVERAQRALSEGSSVDMEYRVDESTGYATWVWVKAEPIVQDGDVVRISGFSRDITDRRNHEHQLSVMDNLLRHNLRNDMNVVLGQAELARREASAVTDNVAVIESTIEGLLDTADKQREVIEVLQTRSQTQSFALSHVVKSVAADLLDDHPNARVSGNHLDDVEVIAHTKLEMAIAELAENAVVHNDADCPSVEFGVVDAGDEAVLVVRDDGAPIPQFEAEVLNGGQNMDNVFHSGGLGLWLVYWIVDVSDGQIDIEADETGNTVRVRLPTCG